MSWLLVIGTTLISLLLLEASPMRLSRSLRIGIGLLLPILLVTWVSFLLSFLLPIRGAVIFGWSTVLVGFSFIVIMRRQHLSWKQCNFQANRRNLSIMVALAVYACFATYLLWTHSFLPTTSGWQSAGSSWGDLALHATYINYFNHQERLSLRSPIYALANSTYPFLFDWYTSLLLRSGSSIQIALIITQWQAAMALILLLYATGRELLTRRATTIITLILFLFGSGSFGWWYFYGDWQASGLPLLVFLQDMPWQYTNMPERHVFFSNVINDMLLPQRGYIIGLAVTAVVLSLTFAAHNANKRTQHWLLITAGVALGLLPLFHAHSFLWAGGWLALYVLFRAIKSRRIDQTSILTSISVLLLALPQWLWYSTQGVGGHFLTFQPGWMWTFEKTVPITTTLSWLVRDFGLLLTTLLALIPIYVAVRWRQWSLADWLYGYSWLWFVTCLLVSFQPWPYDNVKLMMTSFFVFCLFAAKIFVFLWSKNRLFIRMLIILGIFLASASGLLSFVRELSLGATIASNYDVELASQLRTVLDPTGVTLVQPDHNHPVSMLVGQPIVMGYPGWLWSYGIDGTLTSNHIKQLYEHPLSSKEVIEKYDVRYVVIGSRERQNYQIKVEEWEHIATPIYEDGRTVVLMLKLN